MAEEKFLSLGFQADVHQTGGHPAVIAKTPHDPATANGSYLRALRCAAPGAPGGMEDPSLSSQRFATGASMHAARPTTRARSWPISWVWASFSPRGGTLPVNLFSLSKGEEEIGSDNLGSFLEQHRAELDCDVIVISDTGMAAHGYPTLTFSLRGIAALEFNVHGPTQDLHSGVFGGAVMNPATAAARLIASLHDEDGRVAIDGFYDDVRPMFDWEREAAAALPITDADICALAGVPELAGEPGFTAIERRRRATDRRGQWDGRRISRRGHKNRSSEGSLCQADVPARSQPKA